MKDAPFKTIHYVVRFGENATADVYFSRVSKKYDELPIASQMSRSELHDVFLDRIKLCMYLEPEVQKVMLAIKEKYKLTSLPEIGI